MTNSRLDSPRSLRVRRLVIACALALLAVPAAGQDVASQNDGAALFKTYCAMCHDGAAADAQAPRLDTLRQLSAEQVLAALERGSMRARAAERSRAQRRTLAAYVSGKPLASSDAAMPKSAFCSTATEPPQKALAGPAWNGWGLGIGNTRFQAAPAAGMTTEQVPRLALKWAFGFPGASSAGTQPVIVAGRVYVATAEGELYVLDAKTGCVYWTLEVEASVRSAITLDEQADGALVAYFGDQSANVYAVDAKAGKVLWRVEVDEHPHAAITAAPQLHNGRLYVPVSSREESQVGDPRYPCCSFRGSVVALEAKSGKRLWKTYVIPDQPKPTRTNKIGTQLYGPSGAAIWSSPTIDEKTGTIYVATGDSYSLPAAPTSDAVIAFDLTTGAMKWATQTTAGDAFTVACAGAGDRSACPDKDAPDHDFGQSPILLSLAGGKRVLLAGQKSGEVHAFDPDANGRKLWTKPIGRGSALGGLEWGSASDGTRLYAPVSDITFKEGGAIGRGALDPSAGGGLFAINPADGSVAWTAKVSACGDKPAGTSCSPALSAPAAAVPGAIFLGSLDGHFRAYAAADGKVLWDFDTAQEFKTVNGVSARGGSIDVGGPAIANGVVVTTSGYGQWGGMRGNVLLAFSVDGK